MIARHQITMYAGSQNRNDTMIRRWEYQNEKGGDATPSETTDLSPVYITLGGEETIMTGAHLGEGICDELWFWKVIGVREDVREGRWIDGKQSMAIEETTVGEGLAVLFCPGTNNVAVFLVG